jgi:hypothetical protein
VVESDLKQLPIGSRVIFFATAQQSGVRGAMPVSGEIVVPPEGSLRPDPRSPLTVPLSTSNVDELLQQIRASASKAVEARRIPQP